MSDVLLQRFLPGRRKRLGEDPAAPAVLEPREQHGVSVDGEPNRVGGRVMTRPQTRLGRPVAIFVISSVGPVPYTQGNPSPSPLFTCAPEGSAVMATAPPPLTTCPVCGSATDETGCPRCQASLDWQEQVEAIDFVVRRLEDCHREGRLTDRQWTA